jgi:hypothetical protein
LFLRHPFAIGGIMDHENQGSIVERSEYKGKPLIVLKRNEEDKFPFSFGVSKAKLILENVEEIKKFVEESGGIKGGSQ